MSEIDCKDCPHVVGDATERDCCFPDCRGGWDAVYKAERARVESLEAILLELVELKNLKDTLGKTPEYLRRQPQAWDTAKRLVEHLIPEIADPA